MKTSPSSKKKHHISVILILILGTAITVITIAKYYTQSKAEFSASKEAFIAGDWQTAWQHAERLTGWYAFSPIANSEEVKTLKDQSSLLVYGGSSREQGEYTSALQAYSTYLQLYPESAEQYQINTIISELYIEWGQQLQENNQPDLAYQKYQTVLEVYSDTPATKNASKAIPDVLLDWAAILQEKQQASQVQELLIKIIVDYPDSNEAPQARSLIASTYTSIGQQYLAENSFLLALQAYSKAKQFSSDEETKPVLEEGYQAALQGLSNDSGADGQKIIAETEKSICNGEQATSPAVGISKEQPARGILCKNSNFDFPLEWQTTTPGNLKYVVQIDSAYKNVQACFYSSDGRFSPETDTHKLIVRNEEVTVRVLNAESGGVIDSMTFSSTSNYACPNRRGFSNLEEYIIEGKVKPDNIVNWLKMYFE